MKKKLTLILWLLVLLFPLNWLRQESPFVQRHFDTLFKMEWVHIVAHLFIYAGLVMLFESAFSLELNLRTALLLLGVILAAGGLQESFQLLVKGHGFGVEEWFDLGVDLVGGLLGWLLLVWRRPKRDDRYGGSTARNSTL